MQSEQPVKDNFKQLDAKVFPSEKNTIRVERDINYGGAHKYEVQNCLGFTEGDSQYHHTVQGIQFVQRNDDGSIIPGLQSEQLALILLDRAKKLNARFPSPFNEKQIAGLQMFLDGCRERVEDRLSRGVMGELKK